MLRKISTVTLSAGASVLQAPVLMNLYNGEMKLGHCGLPGMPIFVDKAISDESCRVNEKGA
jgi:hypothetical protein